MIFLVLLLVLLIDKLTDWRRDVQHDGPWLSLLRRVEGHSEVASRPWLGLSLSVLLPVLLLGLLLMALKPLAYGWLSLPLHLLVLLYSLGRGQGKLEFGAFRDAWRRGDDEAAVLVAERDLGLTASDAPSLLHAVEAQLLWRSHQGFFAVIFWYVLLGPIAALAYRLLALTIEHASSEAMRERAGQIRHAFDWLPVRVLLASFGLVGNFVAVNRALLHDLLHWEIPAQRLLAEVGPVAADLGERCEGEAGIARLDSLAALLVRARMLWYAAIALWVLLL
ncbi:regulatory signaling modulator protein AmpE [Pseudomonas sp. KSR10]|jgi:AmpE protein|uniref:regulatory signaling modulator protein AmpE n=1 Tax=unclassified Pseudomonas TaxID=196821 RepID=UPI001EF75FBF|nr:regulatory signaling modulator protein AmpE [Pseudomonas sp. KSR10]MCG6540732.1 regulatory signaling modulator protein AmpE [Pseudomonas sp. KSR10]